MSDEPSKLESLIKQHPNDKQSTHLHSLQPGDSLLFITVLLGYKWEINTVLQVTLTAGDAGIIPTY